MQSQGDHYKYIIIYVDDLGIVAKLPVAIAKELMKQYGFNLEGTGSIKFHLGNDYFWDQHGVLCIAPKKDTSRRWLNHMYVCLDRSPNNTHHRWRKAIIQNRIHSMNLIWMELSSINPWLERYKESYRLDILIFTTTIMTLSHFHAKTLQGHSDCRKQIYGYLSKMCNATIWVRTNESDHSNYAQN